MFIQIAKQVAIGFVVLGFFNTAWAAATFTAPASQGRYLWDLAVPVGGTGGSVVFEAKGSNDIHVAFAAERDDQASLYEVVIGGWGNSQTVIRKGRQTPVEGHVRVSYSQNPRAVVDSGIWAAYWVSVEGGLVRVGRGEVPGLEAVLEWQDPNPIPALHWVSFSSWDTPVDYRAVRVAAPGAGFASSSTSAWPPGQLTSGKIEILRAGYGSGVSRCDAREAIAALCDGRSDCSVSASNSLCGDPLPGIKKDLSVAYRCGPAGAERNASAAEWAPSVSLSCGQVQQAVQGAPSGASGGSQHGGGEVRAMKIRKLVVEAGVVPQSLGPSRQEIQTGTEGVHTRSSDEPPRQDGTRSQYRCTTQQMSLEKNADEFVLFNPMAGIVYPGALIQGSTFLRGGSMAPIVTRRGPGAITLALASGAEGSYTQELSSLSFEEVNQAINDLLADFTGRTSAANSISFKEIHSKQHLAAELEANFSGATFDIGTSLSVSDDHEKNAVLVTLKQAYYTIVASPPLYPEDAFSEMVTEEDLRGQIGTGNPAVYVASVTFGRQFFLLFESSQSADELKAAINGSYSAALSADAMARAEYVRQMSSVTVQSYALGGGAGDALAGAAGVARDGVQGLSTLWDFIVEGANFSANSPGYPISYKLANLADNRPLRLATTTDYEVEQCEPVQVGCDGSEGSGKVVDACGVCGGTGACQRPCPATRVEFGNDHAFIRIHLPQTEVGKTLRWEDVGVYKYVFPRCHRVKIESLKYMCTQKPAGGEWVRSGGIIRDANCYDTGNWDQDHLEVSTD